MSKKNLSPNFSSETFRTVTALHEFQLRKMMIKLWLSLDLYYLNSLLTARVESVRVKNSYPAGHENGTGGYDQKIVQKCDVT